MIRLTKLEEAILDTLWELDKAFPKVLLAHLEQPIPPYNTVLSAIRKLEKQGYIGFNKYGKSHEYYPILKREEYGKSLFKQLYHGVLNGSQSSLLSYFIKEDNIDIKELEAMIEELKTKEQ